MTPAFRGLADYGALKQRSNATYDAADADLRSAPDYGSFNNTMSIQGNQAAKMSPWAPYFQALGDQGVSKFGIDTGHPHGLADNPEWPLQGDVGASFDPSIARQSLMKSTNLAAPQPVSPHSMALNGLASARLRTY